MMGHSSPKETPCRKQLPPSAQRGRRRPPRTPKGATAAASHHLQHIELRLPSIEENEDSAVVEDNTLASTTGG
ncbi:hypothetical protein JTE90_027616 [Oedothorax gibbosus]|uniref:Uncharacterized protein n=1 Tax=Oedothorax gibbosus TaxID=931172 RepID=A0AAV6VK10_9ARAC|nr:hypothetical protein JTE90_027616 [Oedothorax gibbosus]